eukprot:jgi/Ulvmu1/12060/UM083_0073.1
MKDVTGYQCDGGNKPDAYALSSSLALAARRQHIDRVLQEMSYTAPPDRSGRLTFATCPEADRLVENGFLRAATTPRSLHSSAFRTPACKTASMLHRRECTQSSNSQVMV